MLKIDLHTHSCSSGHALNTVFELAHHASQRGITHLGITEHGPSMKGAPHEEYFWISDQLLELNGIKIYLGIEANILNDQGDIDLSESFLKKQRIVSAGLHQLTPFISKGQEYNTRSIINAMQNPYVNIITHPFRPEFPIDMESVFYESIKTGTLLELNNSLFKRESSEKVVHEYKKLISLCNKENRKIIIGSDAHIATSIGYDDSISRIKDGLGLKYDNIINNFPPEIESLLENKTPN